MSRIYLPSDGPESWRALLADPENHWSPGYSAETLACCWEAADGGLPKEIAEMFDEAARENGFEVKMSKYNIPGMRKS